MDELLLALQEKQKILNLSQKGLAIYIEVSESQISRIYNGERKISADLLAAITTHFPDLQPLVIKALAEIHNDRNGVKV